MQLQATVGDVSGMRRTAEEASMRSVTRIVLAGAVEDVNRAVEDVNRWRENDRASVYVCSLCGSMR